MKMLVEFFFQYPAALVLLLLMTAFLMPFIAHFWRFLCGPVALIVMAFVFFISMSFAITFSDGGGLSYSVMDWSFPWGIEVTVDAFSAYMMTIFSGISLFILFYSIPSLKKEVTLQAKGWYYTVYLLLVASMFGMVMTNDLFNMYVFIEVTGICACALVIAKDSKEATEAAFKYLLLATIGSGFILFGIGLLYAISGHLNITYVVMELEGSVGQYPHLVWTVLSFFLVGFGIKAALFPFHIWLPDAHSSAPAPSSAALSALVVKVYIIALIKFYYIIFGARLIDYSYIRHIILILAAAAIVGGSIFAYVQLDLKRRLAYSSVAQIGYIFLGIGLGSPLAMTAALLHILNHAVMKSCLFLTAGAIYYQTGKKSVNQLAGIGYKMPVTIAAFTVAAFSMIGIPVFAGFISKWYLALGSVEAGAPIFIVLIVLSGLLNAMYFLPVIWQAYYDIGEEEEPVFEMDKVPFPMLATISALALSTIFLGLFPRYPLILVERAVGLLSGF